MSSAFPSTQQRRRRLQNTEWNLELILISIVLAQERRIDALEAQT
jgi:hypothetical protein